MKDTIYGLDGELEFLVLKGLKEESKRHSEFLADLMELGLRDEAEYLLRERIIEELDDDGCNVEEEETFDEYSYLDDVREGAGYESEEARF